MKPILLPSLCAVLLAGCDLKSSQANTAVQPAATGSTAAGTAGAPAAPTNSPVAAAAPQTPSNAVPAAVTPPAPAVAVRPPKAPPTLPPSVEEVVRLSQTAVDSSVVVSYVEGLREPFTLNADQVIYLSDLGLGTPIINALLKQANGSPAVTAGVATPSAPAPTAAQPAVQNVVIQAGSPQPAAVPAEVVGTPPPAPAGGRNVILTNYLASTNPGTLAVAPGVPVAAAPAPVYGPAQPGPGAVVAQPAQPVVVQQPVTYNVFYESLSPYGSWVHVDPYGWCWQPSVVNVTPGWRPYCDGGQWLWTDYGWYWHSTYTWGWAPFHYGRWHLNSARGWIWCPGNDWGPAWVSWRYSDAHCGWAPLPPECHWSAGIGFTWVSRGASVSVGFGIWDDCWYATSWNRFCDPGLPRWCLDRRDVPRFVRDSRQAVGGDNSVNIVGNNNTVIVNNGVPREEVQRRTRSEVRKYAVQDVATPDRAAQRVSSGAGTARPEIASYRPRIQQDPAGPSAPPQNVLARQESRKNPIAAPAGTTGGSLPSRPSGLGSGPGANLGAVPNTAPSRPSTGPSQPVAGTPYSRPAMTPSTSVGKPAEPASRPGGPSTLPVRPATGSGNAGAPPVPAARPAQPVMAAPTAPAPVTRPVGGTAPVRPSATGSPIPNAPAATPSRPQANPGGTFRNEAPRMAAPLYSQPSYSAPAARPSAPAASPTFRPAPPAPTPAVRQEPMQGVPSARMEMRKPEVSVRPSIPAGRGGYPGGATPSAPSAPLMSAPASPRNYAPAPQPAPQPAPSFGGPRMGGGTMAPRIETRSAPSMSAPAPVMSAPASRPAPSGGGGAARPAPGRGGGPDL